MKVIKFFGYTLRITKTRRATPKPELLDTWEDKDRPALPDYSKCDHVWHEYRKDKEWVCTMCGLVMHTNPSLSGRSEEMPNER